jgi:hypothetical protein
MQPLKALGVEALESRFWGYKCNENGVASPHPPELLHDIGFEKYDLSPSLPPPRVVTYRE